MARYQAVLFAALILGAAAGPTAQATAADEMKGIWGALAYSPSDGLHGFFWGADKKEEAEEGALHGCRLYGGDTCELVTTFRNHRHKTDDDETGYPYEPCAALSVGASGAMGSASAPTRREAVAKAVETCGGDANSCKVREWVCT